MSRTGLLLTVFLAVSCFLTLTAVQADQLSLTTGKPSYDSGTGLWTYSYYIDGWDYSYVDGSGWIPYEHTRWWAIDVGSAATDISGVTASNSSNFDLVDGTADGNWWAWTTTAWTPVTEAGLEALEGHNVIEFGWNVPGSQSSDPNATNPPVFSFTTQYSPTSNLWALSDGLDELSTGNILGPGDVTGGSVPEPGSLALGSLLMLGLGAWRVRRGKRGH